MPFCQSFYHAVITMVTWYIRQHGICNHQTPNETCPTFLLHVVREMQTVVQSSFSNNFTCHFLILFLSTRLTAANVLNTATLVSVMTNHIKGFCSHPPPPLPCHFLTTWTQQYVSWDHCPMPFVRIPNAMKRTCTKAAQWTCLFQFLLHFLPVTFYLRDPTVTLVKVIYKLWKCVTFHGLCITYFLHFILMVPIQLVLHDQKLCHTGGSQ
jgi:hypothetical protein